MGSCDSNNNTMIPRATMALMLSPYGIIIDTTPSRKPWHGQPLMRFVHTDDLIQLCGSLSAAYKETIPNTSSIINYHTSNRNNSNKEQSSLKVRIATHLDTPYRWYELIVVESEPHLQIIIQPTHTSNKNKNHDNSILSDDDDDEKQSSWMHHAVENGVTIVAHALVVLVQLLQDHAGYKLQNVPYELTDKMLSLLAWTGLIKDMGFAKSIVDRLLDQCMTHIALYMDQALQHSNSTSSLCKPTLV